MAIKAIIDADSLVYAAGFSSQRTIYYACTPDGIIVQEYDTKKAALQEIDENPDLTLSSEDMLDPPELAISRIDEAIASILDYTCANDYSIYLTTGDNCWRKAFAKMQEYKGNRKDLVRPVHYDLLRNRLRREWGALIVDYIEADDAVIMDAWESATKFKPIICGIDKDLRQKSGLHFNPKKKEEGPFHIDRFDAAYNFYTQMLTGDSIDNILGLSRKAPERGVGPAKAKAILDGCDSEIDMYEAVRAAYVDRYGDAHTFTAWTGEELTYSVDDIINENAQLLYLRRMDTDKWTPPNLPSGVRARW